MNASQSLAALTAALVHPSAMDRGQAQALHQAFMIRTLALAFAALAAAPFFIAFHGAPTPVETLLFSLCLAPFGAVMLVSTTGRLTLGHVICIACLVAGSATLVVSREVGLGCALAWLIVAQTESLLSFDRRVVIGTGVTAGALFAAIGVGVLTDRLAGPVGAPRDALLVGLALAVAMVNALTTVLLRNVLHGASDPIGDRSRTIADTIEDLVVTFDADGSVDGVGRACDRLLGVPGQELMGRGLFERIHVADRPLFLKTIGDAGHGSDTVAAAVRLKATEEGTVPAFLWIALRARRMGAGSVAAARRTSPGARGADLRRAPAPSTSQVVCLLRDITAQKRNEADLDAARKAAEIATRSQDHFLANMSHELRTPLNAIIGFSEMLGHDTLRPSDPAKGVEYARIIHQSGQHLLAVVNSILDMAKIQSGTFSIVPETFELAPLIASCCDIVTLKARDGRVEIVQLNASAIEPLVGDRRACKQILINLLSNAVKFTPENGRVTIDVRPDGTCLLISVADTGIGIGAADLARLGDPFFQAKSAFDRPYEGTGLGLSVVRGLVGLHGGSMAIESEPGQGTCVTIRLPQDCRFVAPLNAALKIETIARRRGPDRSAFPPHDPMVKKSA